MDDEELRGRGIWNHGSGHRDDATLVDEVVVDAISLELALDRVVELSASWKAIAALNHEILDDAMEDQSIVEASARKLNKVSSRNRRVDIIHFEGHLPEIFNFNFYHFYSPDGILHQQGNQNTSIRCPLL